MTTAPPRSARPVRPRRSPLVGVVLIALVAVTIAAGLVIEFDLLPLVTRFTRGWSVISQFLLPDWAFLVRPSTVAALGTTLATAVVSTAVGAAIALVLSLLASRVTNRSGALYRVVKLLLSMVRSLPDIAWGLLFVAFVGVGAFAGTLALVMFNIGIIAKLTAETVDAVDPGPLEAADAAGANTAQRARVAVLPQILPGFASYTMYVFELNVRAATVLGMVGAGGIGNLLAIELARFNYDNLSALIVLLFVVVLLLDQLSGLLRRRLAR